MIDSREEWEAQAMALVWERHLAGIARMELDGDLGWHWRVPNGDCPTPGIG